MKTPLPQSKKQANFFISRTVIALLKKHVPPRKQSAFVEQAIKKELQHKDFFEAVEKSAGAWKKEDHPLSTEKFIRRLRN